LKYELVGSVFQNPKTQLVFWMLEKSNCGGLKFSCREEKYWL